MPEISVGRWRLELGVAIIDGRTWWTCPVGGEDCGKVLADLGASAIDCMAWHVEHAHLRTLSYRSPV
ncbi:hypothetical protein E1202_01720 [Saccharopolyspora karakumensis]|uniref:Uncharacterized protein n=1 Tax=Saccharopolyspora karakumensis TaxID=2530386 RepID=A0A4V2YYD8_9PSEU|nr:hypothetical protein [Saccharopolyspora karakumensis]TDD92727.1 hypothetical protein E1202_01720 [Saccharopolyspora karakumensis]